MRSVSKYSLKVNIISDISNTRKGECVRSVSKYSLKVNIISAEISQIQGGESMWGKFQNTLSR